MRLKHVAKVRCGQASWVLTVHGCQEPSAGPEPNDCRPSCRAMPHLGVGWELPHESISPRGFESGEGNLLSSLRRNQENANIQLHRHNVRKGRLAGRAVLWSKGKCGAQASLLVCTVPGVHTRGDPCPKSSLEATAHLSLESGYTAFLPPLQGILVS